MTGRKGRGGRGSAAAEPSQAEELALFWAHHEASGEHDVLQQRNFARAADLAYGLGRIVRATFGHPGPYPESLAAAFFQGLVAIPSNISTPANPILRRPGEPANPGGGRRAGRGRGWNGEQQRQGGEAGRPGGAVRGEEEEEIKGVLRYPAGGPPWSVSSGSG